MAEQEHLPTPTYVFLKPLPKGEYNISFSGACEEGRLKSRAKYWLSGMRLLNLHDAVEKIENS